jgi:hypothetical protein
VGFEQGSQITLLCVALADFSMYAENEVMSMVAVDEFPVVRYFLFEQKPADESMDVCLRVHIESGVVPVDWQPGMGVGVQERILIRLLHRAADEAPRVIKITVDGVGIIRAEAATSWADRWAFRLMSQWQVVFQYRHGATVVTVDERYGRAPPSATGNPPVVNLIVDPLQETADVDIENNYYPRRIIPSRIESFKSSRSSSLLGRDIMQDIKTELKSEDDEEEDEDDN